MQRGSGRLSLFWKIKKVLAVRMRNVQVVDNDAIHINVLTTFSHGFSNNLSYSGFFQMAIGVQPTQLNEARKRSLALISKN